MKAAKRVLEKIRRVLTDTPAVRDVVQRRVYTKHISQVDDPIYPAISLYVLTNNLNNSVQEAVQLSVQIDLWLQSGRKTAVNIMDLAEDVNKVLNRQDLTDKNLEIAVASIFQLDAGPVMTDPESNLLHVPLIYRVDAFPTTSDDGIILQDQATGDKIELNVEDGQIITED